MNSHCHDSSHSRMGRGGAVVILGVQIQLVFLGVFLGRNEVFKMSGIFRDNLGADLDPRLDVMPVNSSMYQCS